MAIRHIEEAKELRKQFDRLGRAGISERALYLINEFKIEILPSFFLYKNNSLKWKHSGYISEEDLKKELKRYMN